MVPTATLQGDMILILTVGGMPLPKTGTNHCHAQIGLLRQGLYNQRVGCLMGDS